MNRVASALLGVLVALVDFACPAQNLITNGSFELGTSGPSASNQFGAGSTNLFGWSIDGTESLYWVLPSIPNTLDAVEGSRYVDLNGKEGMVTLSQSFKTLPGEEYEVTFSVGYWQLINSFGMQLLAEVESDTGDVLASVTAPAPGQRGWASPTRFRFTAATASSTLQFTDTTGTVNFDLSLDAVSVERVTQRLSIECSHVRLCWDAQANQQYQIQFRSELESTWNDLGAPLAGTGEKYCVVEEVTETQRFFRVVRLP